MIKKPGQRLVLCALALLFSGFLGDNSIQAQGNRYANSSRGLRQLLSQFLEPKADTRKLTLALRPSRKDIFTYFKKDAAQIALEYYRNVWINMNRGIRPRYGQNRILIAKTTVKELRSGTGNSSLFPGGYKKIAHQLNEGFTIYRFKFVRNNSKFGMMVDGLVFVNGRWVFFPKPWRALGQ